VLERLALVDAHCRGGMVQHGDIRFVVVAIGRTADVRSDDVVVSSLA
jgi:hypothetical protein